jgi:cobalt-precorrin 5A hydrolase/precorrin-3B C17-methyltransferase
MSDNDRILALGFSPESRPLLQRLEQSGRVDSLRWPVPDGPAAGDWLAQRWGGARAVLAVGACGLVTRLIAPLLIDKDRDPAVLVIDPDGRFVVPLLGGHAAGGEQLAREIAALLGATCVATGAAIGRERLPLDCFGQAWGWRRGRGDWSQLMQRDARSVGPATPLVAQEAGLDLWRGLTGGVRLGHTPDPAAADLVISPWMGPGCRWHPPCLWLGLGCERNTSLSLLERLVDSTLRNHGLAPEAVAGLASTSRKGDETALLELARRRGWPLRLWPAAELATVVVPNPSAAVAAEMGTASVAEAAARLAAGGEAPLLVEKTIGRATPTEQGAATLAVALGAQQWAPTRGELHLVGSGPGSLDLLCPDARAALAACTVWVGYGLYLDLLEPLRQPHQLRREGRLTEERQRCRHALELAVQGVKVALVSSGDSGIYGMAGLALEEWLALGVESRPVFQVHPGVSALQLAAARAGAPLMHDFCTISLSDRLTPWEVIERRLQAAAAGDFVVALYNPRSAGRHWQLERARSLLLEGRPAGTPVFLARQLGRADEATSTHTLGDLPVEQVDMLTLVLVGNSTTRLEDGWMVTPRGYPGAELD